MEGNVASAWVPQSIPAQEANCKNNCSLLIHLFFLAFFSAILGVGAYGDCECQNTHTSQEKMILEDNLMPSRNSFCPAWVRTDTHPHSNTLRIPGKHSKVA